jgi:quercetin dioxygenase-like cupin family protein
MKQPTEEVIKLGQVEIRFFVNGSDSSGSLDVFEFSVPPAAKVPEAHFHEAVDEFLYGVEGTLTVTVGDRRCEIGPGDRCFVPRGIVHHFINLHAAPARVLAVWSPALIGPQFFRECAAVVNAGGPPDLATLKAIMIAHGLVPASLPETVAA